MYFLPKQTDLEGIIYGTQDMQGWMQELNEGVSIMNFDEGRGSIAGRRYGPAP